MSDLLAVALHRLELPLLKCLHRGGIEDSGRLGFIDSMSATVPLGSRVNLSMTQPSTPAAASGHVGGMVCVRFSVEADTTFRPLLDVCSAPSASVYFRQILGGG
jgi:hypothetical protein